MRISKKDVKHVAKLSKLRLTASEITKFPAQLSEVINYVKQLDEVNTKRTLPTGQTTRLESKTREDLILKSDILTHKSATSGSSKIHKGYFVVRRVLK